MSSKIAVPALVADLLQASLVNELGAAAMEIAGLTEFSIHEQPPSSFTGPLRRFDRHRATLESIGFTAAERGDQVEVDLDRHLWSLREALRSELEIEREFAEVDPGLQGAARQRRRSRTAIRELEAFIARLPAGREGEDGAGA